MTVCYLVMCVLAYLVTRRYFPVPYPIGRILIYIVLAAGATYLARSRGAELLGSIAVFGGLVTVLAALEWKWLKITFMGTGPKNLAP